MADDTKDKKTKTLELVGGIALVVLALVLVGVVVFAIKRRGQTGRVDLLEVGGIDKF